jgi:hypothetical protein
MKYQTGGSGGNWSPLGHHKVKIVACKQKVGGFKGNSTIVEYEIVESNNDKVKVGAEHSWVQNIDKNPKGKKVKLGNISDFVRAGMQSMKAAEGKYVDLEDIEFDDDDVEQVFGEENPFEGVVMDLRVVEIKLESGQPFHKHAWAAPSDLLEEAAA